MASQWLSRLPCFEHGIGHCVGINRHTGAPVFICDCRKNGLHRLGREVVAQRHTRIVKSVHRKSGLFANLSERKRRPTIMFMCHVCCSISLSMRSSKSSPLCSARLFFMHHPLSGGRRGWRMLSGLGGGRGSYGCLWVAMGDYGWLWVTKSLNINSSTANAFHRFSHNKV